MRSFIVQHTWLVAFWGAIVVLGVIEALVPASEDADRSRRWPTNFGLGIINGLIFSSAPVLTVAAAQWAADRGVGVLAWTAAPWWIEFPVVVLVGSLTHYAIHVISHKIPLLWKLHRVHHCDAHLDVSSALRAHPVEMVIITVCTAPVVVIFGLPPGMVAFYEGVEVFANMFTHANMHIPAFIESAIRMIVMTPVLHRLHHSAFQAETDSNYGNVFPFWDRLFGTYRGETVQPGTPFRFGLDEIDRERAGDLSWQLKLPFVSETVT